MILWLKFICPILILIALWVWNRRWRNQRLVMEKMVVPHYEFGMLDEGTRKRLSVLPGISTVLGGLGNTVKVYQVVEDEEVIAAILFSWPSSLWHFREERGETETLGSYSHIHWVEVLESHRRNGHLCRLLDMVISDTHRISGGITIDIEDPEIKGLFKRKFEFKDMGNNKLVLSYDNWS